MDYNIYGEYALQMKELLSVFKYNENKKTNAIEIKYRTFKHIGYCRKYNIDIWGFEVHAHEFFKMCAMIARKNKINSVLDE